jgi:hypothetical protein
MPLIICPDCTHQIQISDAVRSCPHCGRPIVPADVAWNRELAAAAVKRTAIGCGLVAMAIALLFAWCYNSISSTPTPTAPAVAQPIAAAFSSPGYAGPFLGFVAEVRELMRYRRGNELHPQAAVHATRGVRRWGPTSIRADVEPVPLTRQRLHGYVTPAYSNAMAIASVARIDARYRFDQNTRDPYARAAARAAGQPSR